MYKPSYEFLNSGFLVEKETCSLMVSPTASQTEGRGFEALRFFFKFMCEILFEFHFELFGEGNHPDKPVCERQPKRSHCKRSTAPSSVTYIG